MEKDKILKLLRLSTSDNENEALLAIKKANEILKKNNMSWDDMIVTTERVVYKYRDSDKTESYQRNCGHTGCVFKMRFGKHKDKFLDDIIRDDPDYVDWLLEQDWCSDWLRGQFEHLIEKNF